MMGVVLFIYALLLTHLLPGTVAGGRAGGARQAYAGELALARGNLVVGLG